MHVISFFGSTVFTSMYSGVQIGTFAIKTRKKTINARTTKLCIHDICTHIVLLGMPAKTHTHIRVTLCRDVLIYTSSFIIFQKSRT